MAWLLRDGDVLASLEVAATRTARRRGLLGRDGIDGALLLQPARSVHSFGMRFPIDVAWCDRDLVVLRTARLGRHRVSMPVLRAHAVLEAEAGAFARWELTAGDQLELRDEHPDGAA
ncbi:MAG TPA: DUF192 domain-containing protein [Acidimicrobiales bacterium]|nr:DUF192 domain-containing protein [Acidimicrobiales bacterium]